MPTRGKEETRAPSFVPIPSVPGFDISVEKLRVGEWASYAITREGTTDTATYDIAVVGSETCQNRQAFWLEIRFRRAGRRTIVKVLAIGDP